MAYSVDAKLDTDLECILPHDHSKFYVHGPKLVRVGATLPYRSVRQPTYLDILSVARRMSVNDLLIRVCNFIVRMDTLKSLKNVVLVDQQLTALAAKIAGGEFRFRALPAYGDSDHGVTNSSALA